MNPLRLISHRFQRAPIRHKLSAIIALTCGVGIVVAGAAVFGFHAYTLRTAFQRDVVALAAVVAENLAGPLTFKDPRAALEVLHSLKAKPQIAAAIVRRLDGEVLARVGSTAPAAETSTAIATDFTGWQLQATLPVQVRGETVGTFSLAADFRTTFLDSLGAFVLSLLGICAAALTAALGVGYWLQRFITLPVLRLSRAAAQIGERQDYSVRVAPAGADELGVLTAAFNAMLERIHASDTELRRMNAILTKEIEQRQQLQSELVETSRLAGMAEVATGVLHNVGNVLNSVNVSAGVMREQLQQSRLATLRRVAGLLTTHSDNLAGFFATDEKGRRVPAFLARIVDQLDFEQRRFDTELKGLAANIEHIKEIVAMQQTYAKASALIEEVDLGQLIEQVISIHRSSLQRHLVQVAREFPPSLPSVPTDRHKILQVLTNFVANAIHALKTNPAAQRRLTIAIRPALGTGELALSVSDNGEGIHPDNLKKIFRQGFTTRREGHGFGLHSGVLIVKALGGTLDVESPGPGLGSTFTLRLPLRPAARGRATAHATPIPPSAFAPRAASLRDSGNHRPPPRASISRPLSA